MRTAKNLQKLGKDSAGGTYFLGDDSDHVFYVHGNNGKPELIEEGHYY